MKKVGVLTSLVVFAFTILGCSQNIDIISSSNDTSGSDTSSSNDTSGSELSEYPIDTSSTQSNYTYFDKISSMVNKIDEIPVSDDLLVSNNIKKAVNLQHRSNEPIISDDLVTYLGPNDHYKDFTFYFVNSGHWTYYDFCITVAKDLKNFALSKGTFLNCWLDIDEDGNKIINEDDCKLRITLDEVLDTLTVERISHYFTTDFVISDDLIVGDSYERAVFSYDGNGKEVIDYKWYFSKEKLHNLNSTYYFGLHFVEDDYVFTENYRYECYFDENDEIDYYFLNNVSAYVDLKEENNITTIEACFKQDPLTDELYDVYVRDFLRLQKVDNYFVAITKDNAHIFTLDGILLGGFYFSDWRYPTNTVCYNVYECFSGWDRITANFTPNEPPLADWIYDNVILWSGNDNLLDNISGNESDVYLNIFGGFGNDVYYELPLLFMMDNDYEAVIASTGLSYTINDSLRDIYDKACLEAAKTIFCGLSFDGIKSRDSKLYMQNIFHQLFDVHNLIDDALLQEDIPISAETIFATKLSSNFTVEYSVGEDDDLGEVITIKLKNYSISDSTNVLFDSSTHFSLAVSLASETVSWDNNATTSSVVNGTYDNHVVSFDDIEVNIPLNALNTLNEGNYSFYADFYINGNIKYRSRLEASYDYENELVFNQLVQGADEETLFKVRKDVSISFKNNALISVKEIWELAE